MGLFEKFQYFNRCIIGIIGLLIGLLILYGIGHVILFDLLPESPDQTYFGDWNKGFAIIEYTDGSVKNSEDPDINTFRFQPIKVKSMQHLAYLHNPDTKSFYGVSLGEGVHQDYKPNFNVTGFQDCDGVPIIGIMDHWRNPQWTPEIVTQYYRQYGPNWPDNVFKTKTNYYPALYKYVRSKTAMQLISGDSWDSPDNNINIRFRPENYELYVELDSRRGLNLIPYYIADDNGESYINNLDYTDVMTKTSKEFVKDTIVQSHKVY